MEQILELVKNEFKTRLKLKKLDDYDEIPFESIKELLEDEGVLIYGEFKESLKTPWSVARYIKLYLEEKELIEQVKADLINLPSKIEYCFVKHLSCNVQFTKEFEEGVKKQALVVKYYLGEDDKIQYKLTNANNTSCWDITKAQLHALLANEIIIPEKINKIKNKTGLFTWIKKIRRS